MGGELAYVITQAGIPCVMKDIGQDFLEAGSARCRQVYESKVKRRRIAQDEMENRLALLETTLEYAPLRDASLVIEAVPEIISVKQQVFQELDAACSPQTILASNTSALSITAIGALCENTSRVVGMHFFNPPSMMPLVEIIKAQDTSEQTAAAAFGIAKQLGKIPVPCSDSAGFIVNRLLCAAMLEAMRCEKENLAERRDIDSFLVKPEAGMPIGLFRMADQLGLDLLVKVMKILEGSFGERMRAPVEMTSLYSGGDLGVKTGKGFYDYSDPAAIKPTGESGNRELVTSRILCAVVAEARRLTAEGVAEPEDVDLAMRHGALFKKPPFAYTQETGGPAAMDEKLVAYSKQFGPQFS